MDAETKQKSDRQRFEEYWANGNHIFFDDKDKAWNLWQAALANKPESKPVAWIIDHVPNAGQMQLVSSKLYADNEMKKGTDSNSGFNKRYPYDVLIPLYTATPSTAALQKRIEELEAQMANVRNEALEQAANLCQIEMDNADGSDLIGSGNFYAARRLQEKIRALKAGDVQAPKEE